VAPLLLHLASRFMRLCPPPAPAIWSCAAPPRLVVVLLLSLLLHCCPAHRGDDGPTPHSTTPQQLAPVHATVAAQLPLWGRCCLLPRRALSTQP
jgi:hypothetical protein